MTRECTPYECGETAEHALQWSALVQEATMGLRDKYAYAISIAKGKFDGSAQERDGKLHFVGSVRSEAEKNEIWSAIKTIPDWKNDIVADIKVTGGGAPAAASRSYTVKPGDTLSRIAKEHLGDANAYNKIFELNRDQLSDPDKIKAGQVLKLPS
jgi:nucleoid-associated protein YgaU